MGEERRPADGTTIVQYWHSDEVPGDIEELMDSFRRLNPGMHHLHFCEATAAEFIGDHFGARELAAFRSCAVPAMQADYLRYCAVLALGGVYCDADFGCRRPLTDLLANRPGGHVFRRHPEGNLVNGFFVFPDPGHPLLKLALEVATTNIERRIAERVYLVTGPWIFSSLHALREIGSLDDARRLRTGPRMERLLGPLLEAVGEQERAVEAFADVLISPFELAKEWIENPAGSAAHKKGDGHWVNWHARRGTIFR